MDERLAGQFAHGTGDPFGGSGGFCPAICSRIVVVSTVQARRMRQ
jgi:hypothetical protein